MKKFAFIASIAAFGFIGCGSSESDTLSPEQASLASTATFQALDSVDTSIAISQGEVTASVDCTNGGTASFQGSVGGDQSFLLNLTFDSCAEANLTIDGTLQYEGIVDDTKGVTLSMNGTLTYSGQIEATCDLNVTLSYSFDGGASIEGSICGQNLLELGS